MNFNNPIPRHTGPRFHEASSQRARYRDGDSVLSAWKKSATQSAQMAATTNALQNIQRQIDRMRRRKGGGSEDGTIQLVRFTISTVNDDEASFLATPTDADSGVGPTEIAYPPLLHIDNKPDSIAGYEHQIEPAYAVGQEIIAGQLEDGSWVDLTPGRAWAINLPVCLPGGVQCEVMIHCGSLYESV